MVNKSDIKKTLEELGVKNDDTVIVHSSLKSFGVVDGGADAVIDAFLEYLSEGTLVFPTLRQKDFLNAYNDWDINETPSDVGFITETFRKRPNAIRSNQETHSASAIGVKAEYITAGHNEGRPRVGIWGDYAFSYNSPWQKLYELNAKVIAVGVDLRYNTTKHLVEHMIVNDILDKIEDETERLEAESRVLRFEDHKKGWGDKIWPLCHGDGQEEFLTKKGLVKFANCGPSLFKMIEVKPFVELMYEEFLNNPENWFNEVTINWIRKYKR